MNSKDFSTVSGSLHFLLLIRTRDMDFERIFDKTIPDQAWTILSRLRGLTTSSSQMVLFGFYISKVPSFRLTSAFKSNKDKRKVFLLRSGQSKLLQLRVFRAKNLQLSGVKSSSFACKASFVLSVGFHFKINSILTVWFCTAILIMIAPVVTDFDEAISLHRSAGSRAYQKII